jgi:hypothetical protein
LIKEFLVKHDDGVVIATGEVFPPMLAVRGYHEILRVRNIAGFRGIRGWLVCVAG